MPTLRSAAALLAAASNAPALAPVAAALGCDGPPAALDAPGRAALGLPLDCPTAFVARGPGTLRALLLEVSGDRPIREVVAQAAARIASRNTHALWLLLATRPATAEVVVAAWVALPGRVRVAALRVDRSHVVESDAETLCALAAAVEPVDMLTHARWLAVLGREAVTRRFYRALDRSIRQLADSARGRAPIAVRRDIALLYASRLLFLSFLEAKEWLDGDRAYLARRFDACMGAHGNFQRRVLAPLFFGTLNTPVRSRAPAARALGRVPFLNGGLFARSPLERRHADIEFGDEELGALLVDVLGRYRFTAREDSAEWSEAAVDPEMLGRAFECLMAAPERRSSGAFFTPHDLVARVTDVALEQALGAAVSDIERGGSAAAAEAPALIARLSALRLLDPACGSGAFLVHALERMAGLLSGLGDARPVADLRRTVLTTSIFGVDINPTAVWLCQLRLWLSIVIDQHAADPTRVVPLPNLDRHVRVGDALAGDEVTHRRAVPSATIGRLRGRYARAVGVRKRTLALALDRAERRAAIAALDRHIAYLAESRREAISAARARDLFGERPPVSAAARQTLASLRADLRAARTRRRALGSGAALPFAVATHFADVVAAGGFDVVIGNPPWVRIHRIPPDAREGLRRAYATYRDAAWRDGANAARAGRGFGGQVDLAALFVERALGVVRVDGIVALLVPAKLWRSLAGGGVRTLLSTKHRLTVLDDWSDAPAQFDAAVYPSLVVARRGAGALDPADDRLRHSSGGKGAPPTMTRITVHTRRVGVTWTVHPRELALEDDPGSPWLLLPPIARRAFDAVCRAGTALGATSFGAPLLGVKCGCNGAFLLRTGPDGRLVSPATGAHVEVERELLRPLVRGEQIARWRIAAADEWVIWTHGPDGHPLAHLPSRTERWMRGWRRRLLARTDARRTGRWWELFRTDSAAACTARVVWSDFGRAPRAAVLSPGDPTVPLNTCYAVRCASMADAFALAAVINSPLAAAWLAALAEPARGGYRRFLGWTMARLPLPQPWERAVAALAPVGERGTDGSPPDDATLLDLVTRTYGLRPAAVRALLDWDQR